MAKGTKSYGTVRAIFEREFGDPEFMVHYDQERARSQLAIVVIEARRAAGMTQAELAERVETSQSVIARLESGRDKRMPSLPLLARIATATGRQLVLGLEKRAALG